MAESYCAVALQVGPRRRLPARTQHAHRLCVADAARNLGLRHVARDARLHHRGLHLARRADARAAGRPRVLQRSSRHRRRRRAHLPHVARAARDVRRAPQRAGADGHLPALSLPRDLVDRVRLWLLVEPHCRRGGDAHGPAEPAGGRARCRLGGRRQARCRQDPARQRGHLVGEPDGARGDERRQLRHAVGRRPRAALQCEEERARSDRVLARQRAGLLARAGAVGPRAAAEERLRARWRNDRRAPAALRGRGDEHPQQSPRYRVALQRARQVDGGRDARARQPRFPSRPARAVSPATTRRWASA